LLIGLYTNILENNHFILPDQFRNAFAAGLYITPGFDRNIMMLTLGAFETIYNRITTLSLTDPAARLLLRMFLGSAYTAQMTSDGKIHIPDTLKATAKLEQEVVLVGQGDFIEIWSPEIWDAQARQLQNVEANQFSTLNLTTR